MTCAVVQRLLEKNPLHCTRAERMAVSAHMDECAACAAVAKTAGGLVADDAELATLKQTAIDDLDDPESCE